MSVTLTEAPDDAPRFYQVSVDEFGRMVDAGAFRPGARVELVNGELIEMSPIGAGHAFVVSELDRLLASRLEGRAVIRVQCPLLCGDVSQPQPDLAVVRWPPDRYADRHPEGEDAHLVIEVANSSLRYDEHEKVPLYARVGVPEVWLVDMSQRRVHVLSGPKGEGGYEKRATFTSDDTISPAAFPDVVISVRALQLHRS